MTPPGATGAPHPLVGRDETLVQLQTWLEIAVHEGAALCIAGAAGAGKTALLETLAAAAEQRNVHVLRVTGVEFHPGIGLAALDELLAPLRGLIGSLSTDHAAALSVSLGLANGPPPSELVLCNAVLALLRLAARERPLLVLTDDTHWLDVASKVVLAFAARRLAGSRIGMAMVVRSGTDDTIEAARLPTLNVSALEDASAAELLQVRHPTLAPRVRQRVLAEAHGNPLTLVEVPSILTEAQRTGHADLPRLLPVGPRLSAMFAPRVALLPAEARQPLLRLALYDGDRPSEHLDLDDGPGAAAMAAAERAGLLSRERSDQYLSFRHPLARSAVVELASDLERRRAHRRLAQASPQGSARQVWHLAAAAVGADDSVAAALEQLGRDCLRRGDARGALAAVIRAAELTADDAARGHRYLEAASIGADVTGDLAAAARLVSAAHDEGPEVTSALDAAVAATYLLVNAEAKVDTAHQLLVAATSRHTDPTDATDPTLIDALHSLVMLSWWSGRAELWQPVLSALDQLRPAPPQLLDLCARTFGDPVRLAAPMLATARAVTDRLPQEQNPIEITRAAIGCVYLDRMGDCREALWRVIRDGRSGGAVALAINAIVSSCVDDWLTGQWDEALALAAEGQQLCEQYGYRRYSFILGGYIHALIEAARGETDGPIASADELARWGSSRGAGMAIQFADHVRTVVALAAGDPDEAFAHATKLSPAGEFRAYTPHALWLALDVVDAAVRSDRADAARAHVAAMEAAALPAISSRLALVTYGSAALAAEPDAADALYAGAFAVPDAERWPFELARIHLAYGEHLRQQRAVQRARSEFQQAVTLFDGLGARPWYGRAAEGLRLVGGAAARDTTSDLSAVTPHQWRVAQLAASGLTNRQIGDQLSLSHRTVGATLYQLFPKLGVTSRAGLRDALNAIGRLHPADEPPS